MPPPPDRTPAPLAGLVTTTLRDAALGRARTARLVQAAGRDAWQESLLMAALTGFAALFLIRLF